MLWVNATCWCTRMSVCQAYKDSEGLNEFPLSNAQGKWRFSMRMLVIMAVITKNVGTRKLGSFKTLVTFCHSTQRRISEDCALRLFKVMCSRYRPGMAQRLGRGIALPFHDCDTRRGWVVSSTPQPHFTPGKDPLSLFTIVQFRINSQDRSILHVGQNFKQIKFQHIPVNIYIIFKSYPVFTWQILSRNCWESKSVYKMSAVFRQ